MAASRFGRSDRRRALLLVSLATLSTSMMVAVRRSSEARDLSARLEALERAESTARAELGAALVRADSLSSRARMVSAGAETGLRPATEAEFEWLETLQENELIGQADDPRAEREERSE